MKNVTRKDRRIYDKKMKPILEKAIVKAKELVIEGVLIDISEDKTSFSEILDEDTLLLTKFYNNNFRRSIMIFNNKYPQFDVSNYFFLRALAHMKIQFVIENLYFDNGIPKSFSAITKKIIENVVIENTPTEEDAMLGYFNIHSAINDVLIKMKENILDFNPNLS